MILTLAMLLIDFLEGPSGLHLYPGAEAVPQPSLCALVLPRENRSPESALTSKLMGEFTIFSPVNLQGRTTRSTQGTGSEQLGQSAGTVPQARL